MNSTLVMCNKLDPEAPHALLKVVYTPVHEMLILLLLLLMFVTKVQWQQGICLFILVLLTFSVCGLD